MSQTDRQKDSGGTSTAVSVVIPAYNASKYIGEALDSVFAQTFSDFEVIVVDDGSPDADELERVLAPYSGRIIYLKQENLGPGAARNLGVLSARGEYIAFLDSDDWWAPDYLAEQLRVLRGDPSVSLVCADARLFGDSVLDGKTFFEVWPSREPVTVEKLATCECAVLTMCVVARRRSLVDAGLFDARFFHSEDYDLWLRLSLRGERFAYQHKVLGGHRLHGESLAADTGRLYQAQIEVYRKVLSEPGVSPTQRRVIERQIERSLADLALLRGKQQIESGQYDEAAEALERANNYYRSRKLTLTLLSLRFAPRLFGHVYSLRRRLTERGTTPA